MERIKFRNVCLLALGSGLFFLAACKKEGNKVPDPGKVTPAKSKLALLANEWTLKETFENGTPKTTNGTSLYQFTKNGVFRYKDGSNWLDIGTYVFNDKDSNSLSVLFVNTSMSIWWDLKKFDEHTLNSEFIVGGKTLNYNYVR